MCIVNSTRRQYHRTTGMWVAFTGEPRKTLTSPYVYRTPRAFVIYPPSRTHVLVGACLNYHESRALTKEVRGSKYRNAIHAKCAYLLNLQI